MKDCRRAENGNRAGLGMVKGVLLMVNSYERRLLARKTQIGKSEMS